MRDTTAVIVATRAAGALAQLDGAGTVTNQTVIGHLAGQLAQGGGDILVLARPADAAAMRACGLAVQVSPDAAGDLAALAQAAQRSRGTVAVAAGDLVANDSVISGLLAGASGVRALTGSAGAPVRVERGLVISAGSQLHEVTQPTSHFGGMIVIVAGDSGARGGPAAALSAAARAIPPGGDRADGLDLALVALVRSGVPVRARGAAGLVCARVQTPDEAAAAGAALRSVDEAQVRLRTCVKTDDDLFATYAVSTWSPWLVRLAARLGLSPTAVTGGSVLVAAGAAVAFAMGTRPSAIAGALLLYLSFVLDCVDGQLARYTQQFSRYGGWLDGMADRVKEYGVYAGLAVGAASDVWPLAIAVLTLQTVRHFSDSWYAIAREQAVARLAPAPFEATADGPAAATAMPGPLRASAMRERGERVAVALIAATNSGRHSAAPWTRAAYWTKKVLAFPVGERLLLIGVFAAVASPRAVFVALLVAGGLAAAYTLAVRVWRTRSLRAPSVSTQPVALHRDDGPVARWLAKLGRGRPRPLATAGLAALTCVTLATAVTAGVSGAPVVTLAMLATLSLVLAGMSGEHPHAGALDWLVPADLRAAELAMVIAVGFGLGVPGPLLFALIAVAVLFHYDLVARLAGAGSPLRWRWVGLGWDGRLLVVGACAAGVILFRGGWLGLAPGAPALGFAMLTAYLAASFLLAAGLGDGQVRGLPPALTVGAGPTRRGEGAMTTQSDGTPVYRGSGHPALTAGTEVMPTQPTVVYMRPPRNWGRRLLILVGTIGLLVALVFGLMAVKLWPTLHNPFATQKTDRTGPVLLQSIQDLSRYEAASGNFQVIVDLQKDRALIPDALYGSRCIFVGVGSVDAFVDFSKIGSGAVVTSPDGKSATITLPAPALERPNMDHSKSYTYECSEGVLNRIGDLFGGAPANRENELFQLGEQKIATTAEESGLRERAQTNTKAMLESLLRSLGYERVTVNFVAP